MDKKGRDVKSIVDQSPETWTDEEREMLVEHYMKGEKGGEADRELWLTLLKKPRKKMSTPEMVAFDTFIKVTREARCKPDN